MTAASAWEVLGARHIAGPRGQSGAGADHFGAVERELISQLDSTLGRVQTRRVTTRHAPHTTAMAEGAIPSGARTRGFSLAELMAVVVIVSILATLAIVGMRRYVNSSRTTEATAVIQAIRAAQESYRAESHQYLDVTGNTAFDTDLYPATPNRGSRPFYRNDGAGSDLRWRLLGPVVKRQVRFGYACAAGLPGATPPTLSVANPPAWGIPSEPWYVIQAISNFDGLGPVGRVVASSFSQELYSEPE